MKNAINYLKESKISLIISIIVTLFTILVTIYIWNGSTEMSNIGKLLLNSALFVPITALFIGISKDIKKYKND